MTRRTRPVSAAAACPDCGEALRVTRQPHRYTVHPKWAITVADAEVRHCDKCGYFEVAIPRPDALHRTIAGAVIRKPTLLAGPEIAFLRAELGLTGRALAKALGVVQESVSRWENDALPVSATVDHLLRTMVALTLDGERFPVESLATITGQAGPLKLVVRVDDKGAWKRAA